MKSGFLISVEGADGSGKTTQLMMIEKYLNHKGYEVLMLREPGGTNIGEKIREILLDRSNKEMCHLTEMLLYAASRAQLVEEVIRPALADGKVVVCDRFVDSSLVYQGVARGIGIENVLMVNNLAINRFLPDVTFFLDIDPKVSLERRMATTVPDRLEMEGIELQFKVYHAYKALAQEFGERIKLIDATKPVDEVAEGIRYWMDRMLGP